jgi:hypothetical protein
MLAVAALAVMGAQARPTTAPAGTGPPTADGKAVEAGTLTATDGTWTGTPPITFAYQWRRCDRQGGSCSNIGGATAKEYMLKTVDVNSTLRIRVTATNRDGTAAQTSVPTAVVQALAPPTGTTTTPTPAPGGCPSGTGTVSVADMALPARLLVDTVTSKPVTLNANTSLLTVKVKVMNTCKQTVSGALVYVTATPYNQFDIPQEVPSNAQGMAVLTMHKQVGYPVSGKQQLLALFVRVRKDGEDMLAGVSSRRLVSLPVDLAT